MSGNLNGFMSHGVYNLTPQESFNECGRGAVILDIREEYLTAYKNFKVDDVLFLPYSQLECSWSDLPHDKLIIVADSVGTKSVNAVNFLLQQGLPSVVNMAGGFVDWERDGLPIIMNNAYKLSGSCLCQLKPGKKGKTGS